jgi:hypothetical protein
MPSQPEKPIEPNISKVGRRSSVIPVEYTFDVVFHPTFSTVYTGLLTGHVKAFSYDDQGNQQPAFSVPVRPSKSSCRGLSLDQDGADGPRLYAVGKQNLSSE